MQVNKINSTSFGSGMLVVSQVKNRFEDGFSPQTLDAGYIKNIENGYNNDVIIHYKKDKFQILNIADTPLDKVLNAYTAAMAAPEGTIIDITEK